MFSFIQKLLYLSSLSSPTIKEGTRKYAVSTSQVWHLATESMILSTRKHIVYEALEKYFITIPAFTGFWWMYLKSVTK